MAPLALAHLVNWLRLLPAARMMNPHRNRHEGFMVSIMNPVTWHVVRRTILPGDQRWSSPDKRVAASLSLHDWNREPPT
jgi:hypothetical protein